MNGLGGASVVLFDVVLIVVTMSVLTWLESRGPRRRHRHAAPSAGTLTDDRLGRSTMRRTKIALAAGLVMMGTVVGARAMQSPGAGSSTPAASSYRQEKQDLVAFLRAL